MKLFSKSGAILILATLLIVFVSCQAPTPAPEPKVTPNPSPAPATQPPATPPPAPSPVPSSQPAAPVAPPPAAQTPEILNVTLSLENGLQVVPIGIPLNINYSVNRSANVIIYSTLPDGSTINYVKDICIPGSIYSHHMMTDMSEGERVLTLKATGIDGQTATSTYKYWNGSTPSSVNAPRPNVPSIPPVEILKVTVGLENGLQVVPVGISLNINYSINRSASVIIFSTLPDGSTINYVNEICIPGTIYSHRIVADMPVGERALTARATGIDSQTATSVYKYWNGSVQGNLEKP